MSLGSEAAPHIVDQGVMMPDPQDTQRIAETLALTGASAVVAAMATDAWQAARTGTARLFRHDEPARQEATARQLEADAALVARAADADRARLGLVPRWQVVLEELLHEHGGAAGEVQDLVQEVRLLLPETQKTWVQNNIARDQGQVFASLGGNVIVHQRNSEPVRPTVPQAAQAPGGDRDGSGLGQTDVPTASPRISTLGQEGADKA
jgi:hypothetical protein